MIDLFKNTFRLVMLKYVPLNWLVSIKPRHLKLIPDDLKTQEMCSGAIEKAPWLMHYAPLHFRTQEMCSRGCYLHPMRDVPDHLKTQERCEKAVEKKPYQLGDFPDYLKTQEMCIKTVEYVPDHLKTEEMCKEAVRR